MSSSDRFHAAARRGDTGALKEGTWKDHDRADDKGMTPAMWAAASGHVEALKILVEKGASVNRCDYFGRTALHHAAGNGHVTCVLFLVAFGVNIWSLDNNFNTPLDVAAIHNRMTVVSCLDRAAADQMTTNVRAVKKQRESAIRDAERRAKHFQKSTQEMEVVGGADGMRLSSSRGFPDTGAPPRPGTSPSFVSLTLSSRLSGRTAVSELRPYSTTNFDTDPNVGAVAVSRSSNIDPGSPPYVKSASLLSLLAKKLQRKQRPVPGSVFSTSGGNNSTVESAQTQRYSRQPVGSLFGAPLNGTGPIKDTEAIQDVRPSTPFRAQSQPELSLLPQGILNFGMDEEFDATKSTISTRRGIEHQGGDRNGPSSLESRLEERGSSYNHDGHSSEPSHPLGTNGSATNGSIDDPRRSHEGPKGGNEWANDREEVEGTAGRLGAANNRKRLGTMDGESRAQNGGSNGREGYGSTEGGHKEEKKEWRNDRERTNGNSRGEERYSNYPAKDDLRSKTGNGWINDRVQPGSTGSQSRVVERRGSTLDAFLQAYGLLDYVPVLARERLDMNSLTLVTDLDLKDLGIPLGPRRVLLDAVVRRRTTLANPGRITDTGF